MHPQIQLRLLLLLPLLAAASCVVRPGTLPLDTAGRPVHAHGAGVLVEGDTVFLIGTSQKEAVPAVSGDPEAGLAYLSRAINLYSASKAAGGLCNWVFLGAVLNRSAVQSAMRPRLQLGATARVERPKLARAASGEYVIWAHVQDSANSSYSNVAVARSKAVTGPYTWVANFFANGLISKDSTVRSRQNAS